MAKQATDPAIIKARELFQASGRTLEEVGMSMGFEKRVAKKSVWQLLNKIHDPKLSTLRNFAAAIGVEMAVFFPEGKNTRSK